MVLDLTPETLAILCAFSNVSVDDKKDLSITVGSLMEHVEDPQTQADEIEYLETLTASSPELAASLEEATDEAETDKIRYPWAEEEAKEEKNWRKE